MISLAVGHLDALLADPGSRVADAAGWRVLTVQAVVARGDRDAAAVYAARVAATIGVEQTLPALVALRIANRRRARAISTAVTRC